MKLNRRVLYIIIISLFNGFYVYKKVISKNRPTTTTQAKKKPAKSPSKLFFDKDKKYYKIEEIKELFEKLGITYTKRIIFSESCKMFEHTKMEDYLDYNKSSEERERLEYLSKKYGPLIRNSYVAPVYIKWISDKIGYGLYAIEDIPEGTLIAEYTGIVMYKKDVPSKVWCWRYPIRGDFSDKFPKNISLDGAKFGNELRFINHSDSPNVVPKCIYDGEKWTTCYIASEFIPKDKQIFTSYGQKYWRKRTKVNM